VLCQTPSIHVNSMNGDCNHVNIIDVFFHFTAGAYSFPILSLPQ
jgi:hypothetical protein